MIDVLLIAWQVLVDQLFYYVGSFLRISAKHRSALDLLGLDSGAKAFEIIAQILVIYRIQLELASLLHIDQSFGIFEITRPLLLIFSLSLFDLVLDLLHLLSLYFVLLLTYFYHTDLMLDLLLFGNIGKTVPSFDILHLGSHLQIIKRLVLR